MSSIVTIIKSEFIYTKNSILALDPVDGKTDFRVKLIEYINDTADANDDEFFYDMVEHTLFLHPAHDAVAFTSPDGLIYLNSPNKHVGENLFGGLILSLLYYNT